MKSSESNTIFPPATHHDGDLAEPAPPAFHDLPAYDPAPPPAAPAGPDAVVRDIMKDVLARRARGEVLSDDRVLGEHPDLRTQLAEELEGIRMIRRALLAAQKAGPLEGDAIAPLETHQLEAPIDDAPPAEHLTPWDDPRKPLHVQGYQILSEISRGGQAVVFKAIQEVTGRRVAIKVLTGGALAGSRHRARFEREAQALALLDHPNVVGILDRGRTLDGSFFLVMPFVDGCPLDEYAAEAQISDDDFPLPVLRTFVKIADAVQEAHRLGIIHRDLKPSNIRIDARGEPHLLDFGLARILDDDAGNRHGPDALTILTMDNQVLGSLPWASPEQAAGGSAHVDARGDVYALGVCLYQSLTGRFPYPVTGSMTELLKHITTTPAAPLKWTTIRFARVDALETILARTLAKSPKHRYPSAADLARDLEALLDGHAISPSQGLFNPRARWVRPALWGALACCVAAAAWGAWRPATPAVAPVTTVQLMGTTNSLGMRLLRVPAGEFLMGTPGNARGRRPDEQLHKVRLTRDFWVSDREVTRGQFFEVMKFVPESETGADDSLPVTGVTWPEANEFCRRLSKREGRTYRLPTEAQWEYACRAGAQAPFAGSGVAARMGWHRGTPGAAGLHTGGLKDPNNWNLFDFHGNAAEWCDDRYVAAYPPMPDNPHVDGAPDQLRVVRGGSFDSHPDDCRSAARSNEIPSKRRPDLGFRVVIEESSAATQP